MASAARKRRRAAPRWEPSVPPSIVMQPLDPELLELPPIATPAPVVAKAPASQPPTVAPPAAVTDEWADKQPARSANLVMLWLLLPFIAVILWQLLFDGTYE